MSDTEKKPGPAAASKAEQHVQKTNEEQMGDALCSLESQYLFLTQHLSDILDACTTDDQRALVRENYVQSRRNYWTAINKIFHDDDPKVEAVVEQMADAEDSLEQSLAHLEQISTVITQITLAVKLGGQLVLLAG